MEDNTEKFIEKKLFSELPIGLQNRFKVYDPKFLVDDFEELIIQDIVQNDPNTRIKLNRDVTKMFNSWLENKQSKKENISLNIKGQTRSGKSLVIIKVSEKITSLYDKKFDILKIVCGNQKEYRHKLTKANFGDFYVIDENAFANSGEGSNLEAQQLKDIQNIIAKQNIHTGYVTPRNFLPTNAELGLSYWGKDPKNWLSRFLLYKLSVANPVLLGYVVINVGSLFYEYGCTLYKEFGGCTNPNRLRFKEKKDNKFVFDKLHSEGYILDTIKIDKIFIDNLRCVDKDYRHEVSKANELLTDKEKDNVTCPYFQVCNHPLCKYEHKKDSWIKKEIEGGMDERTQERFNTSIKLVQKLGEFDLDTNKIMLKAKNGKDLVVKVKLFINEVTATKYTITETDEIINTIKSMSDLDVLLATIKQLKLDPKEELSKIENMDAVIPHLGLDNEQENK